jgi:predicted house-cleaning noncanonical NTP pyrophosphatase (MazG superfamily)
VECVDLFGVDEDVVEFNKIVRDKIPRQIESRGEVVESIQLRGEALVLALKRKLVEESYEALDARSGEELVSELADLEEVVLALLKVVHSSVSVLDAERKEKRRLRGGFTQRLMLVKTATLHSLRREQLSGESRKLDLKTRGQPSAVISNPKELPSDQLYRRPDLRYLANNEVEKLITFELTANQLNENARQTYRFQMPLGEGTAKEFELGVQLVRERSKIRGIISLRSELIRSDFGDSEGPQLRLKLQVVPPKNSI